MADLQAMTGLCRLSRIVQQRRREEIGLIVACVQQRPLHVERMALIPLGHAQKQRDTVRRQPLRCPIDLLRSHSRPKGGPKLLDAISNPLPDSGRLAGIELGAAAESEQSDVYTPIKRSVNACVGPTTSRSRTLYWGLR